VESGIAGRFFMVDLELPVGVNNKKKGKNETFSRSSRANACRLVFLLILFSLTFVRWGRISLLLNFKRQIAD
jgi:hypothetical protein